jgi:hypothetical protein
MSIIVVLVLQKPSQISKMYHLNPKKGALGIVYLHYAICTIRPWRPHVAGRHSTVRLEERVIEALDGHPDRIIHAPEVDAKTSG